MARAVFNLDVTVPQFDKMLGKERLVPVWVAVTDRQQGRITRRVRRKHRDADDRPLPKYKVRSEKHGGRWTPSASSQRKSAHKRRMKSGGSTISGKFLELNSKVTKAPTRVPPEIFQVIRENPGCVVKSKQEIRGKPARAVPLRYKGGVEQVSEHTRTVGGKTVSVKAHKRRAVSQVEGKNARHVWGWMWPNEAAFIADMYGGPDVDYSRTGTMWRDLQKKIRFDRGRMRMIHRFKGQNPRGKPSDLAAKYSGRKRMPSSIKAMLTNRRDSQGVVWPGRKTKWGSPRVWFHATDNERAEMIKDFNGFMNDNWRSLPAVRVTAKKGGVVKRQTTIRPTSSGGGISSRTFVRTSGRTG